MEVAQAESVNAGSITRKRNVFMIHLSMARLKGVFKALLQMLIESVVQRYYRQADMKMTVLSARVRA
jgi:hypothetical protein